MKSKTTSESSFDNFNWKNLFWMTVNEKRIIQFETGFSVWFEALDSNFKNQVSSATLGDFWRHYQRLTDTALASCCTLSLKNLVVPQEFFGWLMRMSTQQHPSTPEQFPDSPETPEMKKPLGRNDLPRGFDLLRSSAKYCFFKNLAWSS